MAHAVVCAEERKATEEIASGGVSVTAKKTQHGENISVCGGVKQLSSAKRVSMAASNGGGMKRCIGSNGNKRAKSGSGVISSMVIKNSMQ